MAKREAESVVELRVADTKGTCAHDHSARQHMSQAGNALLRPRHCFHLRLKRARFEGAMAALETRVKPDMLFSHLGTGGCRIHSSHEHFRRLLSRPRCCRGLVPVPRLRVRELAPRAQCEATDVM